MIDKVKVLNEKDQPTAETESVKKIFMPPMAWYGGSWAYTDPEPEPETISIKANDHGNSLIPEQFNIESFGNFRPPSDSIGVILGRFLPPHPGHQYLIEFARAFAHKLTIFLNVGKSPEIPGAIRKDWLHELFPEASIVKIDYTPTLADISDEQVRKNWTALIKEQVPNPNYIFSSESYAYDLAAKLGATWIQVDPERRIVPISSTQILTDPLECWEYLLPCVRAYFTKRICLIGPQGTGKSTLARRLAAHYNTLNTEEFARTYTAQMGSKWVPQMTQMIFNGQIALETALARRANQLLFCDTDVLSIRLWCEKLFGVVPDWLRNAANTQVHDLYLVSQPSTLEYEIRDPNVKSEQLWFYENCLTEIRKKKRPFVELTGDWDNRFLQACNTVNNLIKVNPK